jgi:hypothetical protein
MDIKNQIIAIPTEDCDALADEYFMATSGIDRPGPKYERMRKEAFEIRERIRSRVNVKAIYSYYDMPALSGSTATIDGVVFHCNAFEQMNPESIQGVYVHLLTAGEYHLDGEPIMNQLFADIWGTAFTEAGRMRLEEMLEGQGALSDGFGPGFYGMESIQMKELTTLLDGAAIGVETRATGILLPLKSCGGMTFRVDDSYIRLSTECADCRGNKSGCAFCNIKNKERRI